MEPLVLLMVEGQAEGCISGHDLSACDPDSGCDVCHCYQTSCDDDEPDPPASE